MQQGFAANNSSCPRCNQHLTDRSNLKTKWSCDICKKKYKQFETIRHGCSSHDYDVCSGCYKNNNVQGGPPIPYTQQQQFNQPPQQQQQFNQPPQQQQGFNQPPQQGNSAGTRVYFDAQIKSGQILYPNQYVTSPNQQYQLFFHPNGNLALYTNNNFNPQQAIWQTYEPQQQGFVHPYQLRIEHDGSIGVFDSQNRVVFSNNIRNIGQAPYRLVVQDDRNVQILDIRNTTVWQSHTTLQQQQQFNQPPPQQFNQPPQQQFNQPPQQQFNQPPQQPTQQQAKTGVSCPTCASQLQDMSSRKTNWTCEHCKQSFKHVNQSLRLRCQPHDFDLCGACSNKISKSFQESANIRVHCDKCRNQLVFASNSQTKYNCDGCNLHQADTTKLRMRCKTCDFDLCSTCSTQRSQSQQFNQPPNQFNQPPNQFNQHPQQFNQPPNQFNQPPQQFNQPPQQFNQPPNQFNQPPQQQFNQPPQQQFNQPPQQQFNQPPPQQNVQYNVYCKDCKRATFKFTGMGQSDWSCDNCGSLYQGNSTTDRYRCHAHDYDICYKCAPQRHNIL